MTMDVEKLKKLNDLAKSLQEKGLAKTSEEAVKQAQQAFEDSLQDNPPPQPEPEPQPSPPPEPPVPPVQEQVNEAFLETKFKLLIDMNNNKLMDEFKSIRMTIDELNGELSTLRAQIKQIQEKKPQPKQESQQKPKQEQQDQQQLPKPPENHPRQGNFTSDDVSIEKMFHFGGQ